VLTVVSEERQASLVMAASAEGIFVVDSLTAGGDLNPILKNHPPGWPVLVLAAHFDSSAWVEMFKAGASEVIADPLTEAKLDVALDALAKTPSRIENGWRAVARLFGFGMR